MLAFREKRTWPHTFSPILIGNPKGEELKGRGWGRQKKNEFILSKLCSKTHVSLWQFSFLYMQ